MAYEETRADRMLKRLEQHPEVCPACCAPHCTLWNSQESTPQLGVEVLPGHMRAFKEIGFTFDGLYVTTTPNY